MSWTQRVSANTIEQTELTPEAVRRHFMELRLMNFKKQDCASLERADKWDKMLQEYWTLILEERQLNRKREIE